MIVYRLLHDFNGRLEGSCITEVAYKELYYRDRPLYEPITDEDRDNLIEFKDDVYCRMNGITCVLFYNNMEYMMFLNKIQNAAVLN